MTTNFAMKKNKPNKSRKLKSLAARNPINLQLALRVVEIVDAGLVGGVGRPEPGKMCVEAAVNYAQGDPHGDKPKCVDKEVRNFKIELNDHVYWYSTSKADGKNTPRARAKALRRIAVAQLGSADMEGDFVRELNLLWLEHYATTNPAGSKQVKFLVAAARAGVHGAEAFMEDWLDSADIYRVSSGENAGVFLPQKLAMGTDSKYNMKKAIALGIEALRRCGSPGVALMDRLIKSKVL